MKPEYLVIVGPTASGKSSLAMSIAKQLDGEIICADSRTIYRGMDIGTAKPTQKDQLEVRHWCIDLVNPDQRYTAADFKRDASLAIKDIKKRNKLPIVVGGSGLYINGLVFDYQFGADVDVDLRRQLSLKSTEDLIRLCQESEIKLPENYLNRRHLIRAIEMSKFPKAKSSQLPAATLIGIEVDRTILRQRIAERIEIMLTQGLIAETKSLISQYGFNLESMTSNIYSLVDQLVQGQISNDEFMRLAILKDYHLAKRQMTWFRSNKYITWHKAPFDQENIVQKISSVLELR